MTPRDYLPTNARVVYLFHGPEAISENLGLEVLDLMVQPKAGTGPGVAPGKVEVLSSTKRLGMHCEFN